MIKYVFSLLFVLISITVMGQKKKSVVRLIQSQSSQGIKINGKDVIKVFKGTFQQDYSVMRSDSAYFYLQDNAFDAFGHVNITQGDTLNIYSDKLNYNGNTKIALLTDNVRMIDKDATLTTNFLTYNTATRIGTYTGGGKLVNKDNTLTSKNGYYFAFSRDAYFRYNVVLVTPEALIKTDTLRYSTASRIAYFLGPTNIYDVKDKKDTLYTENGTYNTITEQAFFGKKNLYKSGTKTLKGDSLFYDKLKGFGKAIRHVVFNDREQKITLKGDLANYYKAEERTLVTKDPYVIIISEEKDTTKTDTVPVAPIVKGKDGKPVKADTKKPVQAGIAPPANTSPIKSMPGLPVSNMAQAAIKNAPALPKSISGVSVDSAARAVVKKAQALPIKSIPGLPIKGAAKDSAANTKKDTALTKIKGQPDKIKRDSIYISADTLETQIVTFKNLKAMQEKDRLSHIRDTTAKAKKAAVTTATNKKESKFLSAIHPGLLGKDSSYLHRDFFGAPKPEPVVVPVAAKGKDGKPIAAVLGKDGKPVPAATVDKDGKPITKKKPVNEIENDPVFRLSKAPNLSDTARIRIVKAYHHAKLFKSDLQAKSDSMFYSYSDSTLRLYMQPLIWTKGSQLSGDTVNLQLKNKKLDNMYLFPTSFIVNVEKDDSTHFNQIAGKRMRGFFKSDKLDRLYITGNAESIYFQRDSGKISGMQRSLSSRMNVVFKSNNAKDIHFITKPEHRYGPLKKFQEDELILKGFIWKPKERPISKESILPSWGRKHNPVPAKTTNTKAPGGANKTPAGTKAAADSLLKKVPGSPLIKAGKDSVNSKLPLLKTGKDTIPARPLPLTKPKADTSAAKKL